MREGLRAGPVSAFAGFVGLGQEALNFFNEIVLRGVQAFAGCLLQVSLGDCRRRRRSCASGWLDLRAKAAAKFAAPPEEYARGCSA